MTRGVASFATVTAEDVHKKADSIQCADRSGVLHARANIQRQCAAFLTGQKQACKDKHRAVVSEASEHIRKKAQPGFKIFF